MSQLQRLLAQQNVGDVNDPKFRHERAVEAGKMRHTLDAYIARIVRDAGQLNAEQIEALRSVLPAPEEAKT